MPEHTSRNPGKRSRAFPIVLLVLAAGFALSAAHGSSKKGAEAPPVNPDLAKVLARFDEVQASIRSLSAEFTETRKSPLLKEPIVSKGRFFLTKPKSVMWEYLTPEAMRFVIANDEYVGYFPGRKRAERRDIHRFSDQLFRFFGLGQGSAELQKFYEITLGDAGTSMKGTHLLVLSPKKKRAKKALESVLFWVDAERMLPRKVAYRAKDGSTREFVFGETRVNPDFSASLYEVRIPPDYTVTSGFSGFDLAAEPN